MTAEKMTLKKDDEKNTELTKSILKKFNKTKGPNSLNPQVIEAWINDTVLEAEAEVHQK
jgi:hypothetical protein